MQGRAFPGGNVLLFFCRMAALLRLPGGKSELAFLAVVIFQNRRIKAPGQMLDSFVRVARPIHNFFLFVQVHLLFRSTHLVYGVRSSAKPQVWKERSRPFFAVRLAPQFSAREYKNTRPTRPIRPHPPQDALWGGWQGGKAGGLRTKTNDIAL